MALSFLGLSCVESPPPPTTFDPTFWSEVQPCASYESQVAPDGATSTATISHEYDGAYVFPGAWYFAGGNIQRVTFVGTIAGDHEIRYRYDDDERLIGADVTIGSRTLAVEVLYDGDRRLIERGDDGSDLWYVYDGERHAAQDIVDADRVVTRVRRFEHDPNQRRTMAEQRISGFAEPTAVWRYEYSGARLNRAECTPSAEGNGFGHCGGVSSVRYEYACP